MTAETIGIVGMGEIGRRMGRLLVRAERDVVGYDISPAAMEKAAREGIRPAQSLAELCRQAAIVITCVTDGAALNEVAAGLGGLEENLRPGAVVVDTTSAEPWISREIAMRLREREVNFLDAPVSGGVPAAERGRMNFMVGGDAILLDRLRPLLSILGPVATHVGPVGSGHTIKAVNMLALASSMVATAEIVALGTVCGNEASEVVAALDAGEGASYSTRLHYPRFILPGNFASGFSFDLMLKDLAIGIDLANRANVPLHLMRSTFELYRAASHSGLLGRDNSRIVNFRFGHELPAAPGYDLSPYTLDLAVAGSNAAIAGEALSLGAATGLSMSTTLEVLSAGSGDSRALSGRVAEWVAGRGLSSRLGLDQTLKAQRAAIAAATTCDFPLSLLFQSYSLHCAARASLGSDVDSCAVVDLIAQWAGCSR